MRNGKCEVVVSHAHAHMLAKSGMRQICNIYRGPSILCDGDANGVVVSELRCVAFEVHQTRLN